MVSDREIISAYRFLAKEEGVFVEPASAASVAGLFKLQKSGYFDRYKTQKITIVCTLTGSGLKDPQIAVKKVRPPKVVEPTVKAVLREAKI